MRGASAFVDTGKTPAARFSQGFLPCPALGFSVWRWWIPGHEVMEGCRGRGRLDGPQRERGKEPPARWLQGGQDWQPSPPQPCLLMTLIYSTFVRAGYSHPCDTQHVLLLAAAGRIQP